MVCSNPSPPSSEWYVAGVIVAAPLALALAVSARRNATLSDRAWTGFAAVIACIALWPMLLSYLEMYDDLPWPLLLPLLAVLIIGGWKCHQKWLAVATAALAAFLAFTALTPPEDNLPRTQTLGDVTAIVQSVRHNGVILSCDFALTTPPGTEAGDICDLQSIRCAERVCRLMPVSCWRPFLEATEEERNPDETRLNVLTFPPGFANSVDLAITVLQWPREPAVSLDVPLPSPSKATVGVPFSTEGNGVRLTVADVRPTASRDTRPPEPCIALTIAAENAGCIRARDPHGHTLPLQWSRYGADRTTTYEAELLPIPKDLNRITIDAFTPEQVERNTLTFRFPRLPNH
jgi:hypothetical protein